MGIYFKSGPPTLDTLVFSGNKAIVYYLPGTTGWGTTLGGFPTELWIPLIQTGGASLVYRAINSAFTLQAQTILPLWWKPAQIWPIPFGLRSRPTRSSMVRSISAILSGRIIPGDTTLLVSPDSQVMGEPLKQIENSIPPALLERKTVRVTRPAPRPKRMTKESVEISHELAVESRSRCAKRLAMLTAASVVV